MINSSFALSSQYFHPDKFVESPNQQRSLPASIKASKKKKNQAKTPLIVADIP